MFAPSDFVRNSDLGLSNGRVYKHIFDAMFHNEGAFERPEWFLHEFAKVDGHNNPLGMSLHSIDEDELNFDLRS